MLICLNDLFACLGLDQTRKLLTNFSKNPFYLLPEPLRLGEFLTNYWLKGITDGRFIQRQKARANRTLRDLRNDFLDNFVTIVQSYDKSLATKINKTINDLQDLCSQQIDNYSNTDISQIKKKIYENRASLISLLYEGIKEEKEKWYKRIFKWRRR